MRALITGVCGQDGYYLAQTLIEKGYKVYGGYRGRIPDFGVDPVPIEMSDFESVSRAVRSCQVDEVYNLAGASSVGRSFNSPYYTQSVNGDGCVRILEVLRGSRIRLFQASSSEMFGSATLPQNERTPFAPRSPYGASKVYAHQMSQMYREAYGVRVSCGIMFSHESPRRGTEFVTRKITYGLANYGKVTLENLDAQRDWGHARDYMEAAWMMLQRDPDDFVIGTGETHSVGDFLTEAMIHLGGEAVVNERHRPLEVSESRADITKALIHLDWKPTVGFRELVREMCEADQAQASSSRAA